MRRMTIFVAFIIIFSSVFFGGTTSFAANNRMYYKINPAVNITSTSAYISGEIIPGEKLNDDLKTLGYAFYLEIHENDNPANYMNIPIEGYAANDNIFNKKIENLKPDTEYAYFIKGGMNTIAYPGTIGKRLFKTLPHSTKKVLYGDVTGDGVVNSTDYLLVRRYILEIIKEFPTPDGFIAADVNADGRIDSSDCVCIKRYILGLITVFPADEAIEGEWVPYELEEKQVAFRVEENGEGIYIAIVSLTFPSMGYRVTGQDKVSQVVAVVPDPDGANISYRGDNAFVEAWTGSSPALMDTKELKYTLGSISPGKYKFCFTSNSYSKEFLFEIKEGDERWIHYHLKEDQVSYYLGQNIEGEYFVNVKLNFPHSGYKVSYENKIDAAINVSPDIDGARISFMSDIALIETWTGDALTVMTTKELKYTLGKLAPGIYKFYFNANGYVGKFVFEIKEETGETWEMYMPDSNNISYFYEEISRGRYNIVIVVNFPNSGYKVEYSDQLAVAVLTYPDGTTKVSSRVVWPPTFFRYTGQVSDVETPVFIRYAGVGPNDLFSSPFPYYRFNH